MGKIVRNNFDISPLNVVQIDGKSKLPQVIDKTVTEITAEDLEGAISISERAFEGCENLTSITIPDSVTSIVAYAFNNCSGLTNVKIGNGITTIGGNAFSGCYALTSITIPDSVTSIGGTAFYKCSSLTEMTILATTPPTLVNTNAISTATSTIYIPAGTLEAYQGATN